MQYHISRQGQTYGPYPAEDVKTMLGDGRLLPVDLCWREGMAGWKPLGEVFGASSPFSAMPPQPVHAGDRSSSPAPGPAGGSPWPVPPDLHWLAVLLLSYATCGLFGLIWMFFQAGFVKKIHPGSPARAFLAGAAAVLLLGAVWVSYAARTSRGIGPVELALLLPLYLSMGVFYLGVFSMRRSLLYHYNTVEDIGLRLHPVLTFFFNVVYFQYHFSRIARWKRTGAMD